MARILVVDDDDSVRGFTARALKLDGHDVDEADDGDIALDRITQTGGRFDLVLSDIRMPAMDGIEMARNAADAYPGLRILLMTGYAEQRERSEEIARIIIDVISKPFSLADIRRAVGEALAA
ncbi:MULTISPECIES: response regulator [unclassified Roseitalea]|uniref:response regulator n=1 Tax=unclassified Roseitalea TaxID=2639107 RepID=UPI002740252E|nr:MULTISPECIES: response regulator [unclassified Roseitalea]